VLSIIFNITEKMSRFDTLKAIADQTIIDATMAILEANEAISEANMTKSDTVKNRAEMLANRAKVLEWLAAVASYELLRHTGWLSKLFV